MSVGLSVSAYMRMCVFQRVVSAAFYISATSHPLNWVARMHYSTSIQSPTERITFWQSWRPSLYTFKNNALFRTDQKGTFRSPTFPFPPPSPWLLVWSSLDQGQDPAVCIRMWWNRDGWVTFLSDSAAQASPRRHLGEADQDLHCHQCENVAKKCHQEGIWQGRECRVHRHHVASPMPTSLLIWVMEWQGLHLKLSLNQGVVCRVQRSWCLPTAYTMVQDLAP